MTRALDTNTLDDFARACLNNYSRDSAYSKKNPKVAIVGKEWVLQSLYQLSFKDEFDYIVEKLMELMPEAMKKEFKADTKDRFTPRSDAVLAEQLEKRLAVDIDGNHVPGKIGSVIVGSREVATRVAKYETKRSQRLRLEAADNGKPLPSPEYITKLKPAVWPVYAGEDEERAVGSSVPDPLPDTNKVFGGDEHLQPVKKEA